MVPEKKWDIRDVSEYTGKGKVVEGVFGNSGKEEETDEKLGVVGEGCSGGGLWIKGHWVGGLREGDFRYTLFNINIVWLFVQLVDMSPPLLNSTRVLNQTIASWSCRTRQHYLNRKVNVLLVLYYKMSMVKYYTNVEFLLGSHK